MKKVKNILSQENTQKTSQQEKVTPLGHQKLNSNKQEFVNSIDNLFLKLELAYHYQFYKVFGTDERLNEGKKLWAISLKNFSPETIIEAVESVVGSQSYLPTLTDIIKSCTDIVDQDGYPSSEEAYIEARKSFAPRNKYPWSHPIVYFAGKKIGWSLLEEKNSKELFFAYKKTYLKLKELSLNGSKFEIEIEDLDKDSTPLNKKLFESLRKKHKI